MDNNNQSQKNENRLYIGKVQITETKYGQMTKILINNPYPTNEDGTPNQYYTGNLVWVDKNGEQFILKSLEVKGVSPQDAQRGFTNSIAFVKDSVYNVVK
jgi:hypothetical protein